MYASELILLLNYSFATKSNQNFLYVFSHFIFLSFFSIFLLMTKGGVDIVFIYKALIPINLISKTN